MSAVELIFADDCAKDRQQAKYLVVAAVSFNEQHLAALEAALAVAKLAYGIDLGYELTGGTARTSHDG